MSLFLKIFLWFWLAMALVGLALVISTATTQSEPLVARWRSMMGDALTIYAQTAVEILERDGTAGLAAHLARVEQGTHLRAFVFDEQGREVTGRVAPSRAKDLAASARHSGKSEFEFSSAATLAAQTMMTAPPGSSHVLVVEVPGGRFSALHAVEPRTQALRLVAVLLTAGIVCYWLARYLSAPIVKLRAAARRIASGDLSARVATAPGRGRRDELADLSRDFDLMAERIESLMTAQRGLINDISHELRSPLARLGVALGLARQRAAPEASSALDRIELEAERLNTLIGQLLTLARLESGAERSAHAAIDLASLVREIAGDADFEARNQERRVRIVQCEECIVGGSPELLRSAIENVIRNGVRYTAVGTEVEISLRVRTDSSATNAIISVRDHGAGVPAAALADLFRPFYRTASARERQTGGVGLGLSITERAVIIHGGTVRASNAPGGGLVVEIRLPIMNDKG